MSRKANCWDNAVVEPFFKTLKVELVCQHNFKTIEQAKSVVFEYIEDGIIENVYTLLWDIKLLKKWN